MFFFFNDTATTEIYTLSLHDALPILYADPRKTPAEITAPPTFSSGAHRTVHEGASGLGLYRFATSFSAVQTAGSSACSASPCSSSHRSASIAARQPSAAAVTAWR